MARAQRKIETEIDPHSLIGAAPAPTPRSKRGKPEITVPVKGLEVNGALAFLKREIDGGFLEVTRLPIEATMMQRFIDEGVQVGRTPANFTGVEGLAKASLQMKKRSASSPLTDEQVELLKEFDLPFEEVVDREETYELKPDVYQNDKDLVTAMLTCLRQNGFDIGKLFQHQPKTFKNVVAATTIDKIFEKAKEARAKRGNRFNDLRVRQLLDVCATLSVRPDWEGTVEDSLSIFRRYIAEQSETGDEAAAQPPAAELEVESAGDAGQKRGR